MQRWVDTANVKDAEYNYVVENHLFKDTYIELKYGNGEHIRVGSDYKEIIAVFLDHGKEDLVKKLLKSMNEHFIKLRDSDRKEIREFYPEKTAEEMFLGEELEDAFQESESSMENIFKERRMALRLTQQQVADRAGIKQDQYQRFESGARNITSASFHIACSILEALEMDIVEFHHSNRK